MKLKYALALMDMTERFALTSEATRLKVGCLIYNNGIIAEGINGQPSGWPTEVCEDEEGNTLPTVRHAEISALEKLWAKPNSSEGATMFVSALPCMNCAIKIVEAKIKRVYYRHVYRSLDGLHYLQHRGVEVIQI